MTDSIGQEINIGDYLALITPSRGSVSVRVGIAVGFTPAKVKIYSKYELESMLQNRLGLDEPRKHYAPSNRTTSRIIVLSEENARNSLKGDFEKIDELRREMLNIALPLKNYSSITNK